jgi:tRNA (guanine37-N1)-methyltransferase
MPKKVEKKTKINFHIITIFPKMFDSYFAESILHKAIENDFISVNTYALREYTTDKHRRVDGRPFAGGPGMVLWVEPILNCVEEIKKKIEKENKKNKVITKLKIINFIPSAPKFTTGSAKKYAQKCTDIIFICGRYEGVDARVDKILKTEKVSIGDFVLTGGELPTMVLIDSISRQIKGVLNDNESLEENRVSTSEIYARPEVLEYKNKKYKVPKVLLSGNHKLIEEWKLNSKKEK